MHIGGLWRLFNSEEIFKYGLAVILIVIPLYPKFPILNIPGTYVAIRMEDFVLGILGILVIVSLFRDGIDNVLKNKLYLAMFLFILVGGLSLVSALLLTKTVAMNVALLHWIRRIEYIIPFLIAYKAIQKGGRAGYYLQILAVVTLFAFLVGFLQRYFQFPIISTQNEEYSKGAALRWIPGARLPSTFAGHYDLAAFLVLVFPIFIACLSIINKLKHKVAFFFLLLAPAYWLFLQTESRISFGAYLIAISFMLIISRKKKYIVPFFVLSMGGMIILSGLGVRYTRTLEIYKQRLIGQYNISFPARAMAYEEQKLIAFEQLQYQEPTVIPEDRSVAIRTNVEWPRAIRAFLKNPLLGTGYSSLNLATDNDYLRMLGEVGIVGTLAFFLVLGRLIEGFGSYLRRASLSVESVFVTGFAGSLLGLLITATFIDAFEASKIAIIFWALAGIAYGIVNRGRVREEEAKND